MSSVAEKRRGGQPSRVSAGVWDGSGRRSPGRSSWPRSRLSPRSRSQKPKPKAASLFKWALALELDRERKAEPVGAGR